MPGPGSRVRTCNPQLTSSLMIQSIMEDAGKGQREFLSVSEGAVSSVKAHGLRSMEPKPLCLGIRMLIRPEQAFPNVDMQ